METETLVVAHLKEGMLEKFMGFMQSDAGMAERSKVANVSKTIGTVAPDKKTVMFKIFVTDKAAHCLSQAALWKYLLYKT